MSSGAGRRLLLQVPGAQGQVSRMDMSEDVFGVSCSNYPIVRTVFPGAGLA